MNLVQGTYAAVLGLAMGYLAYKYGSVVPGILLHIVINSSSYLISYVFPEALGENSIAMSLIGVASLGLAVIFLAVAGKGVEDRGRLAELDGIAPISSVNENESSSTNFD
jgi:membrane protease YdiL (CAAX protease family)